MPVKYRVFNCEINHPIVNQSINQFISFSRNPFTRLLPHGYGNSKKNIIQIPSNMNKNNEQYYVQEEDPIWVETIICFYPHVVYC